MTVAAIQKRSDPLVLSIRNRDGQDRQCFLRRLETRLKNCFLPWRTVGIYCTRELLDTAKNLSSKSASKAVPIRVLPAP